jgi:chromatin structure-remodeling complex subunit RSC4
MSDLPPPFALSDYSKPSKLKLKVPAIASAQTIAASSPQLPSSNAVTSSGSLRLRVPAVSSSTETQTMSGVKTKATAATTPAAPTAKSSTAAQLTSSSSTTPAAAAASPAPTAARTPVQPKSAPIATPPPPPAPAASSQPPSHPNLSYSQHYPNASYLPPAGTSTAPNPTASTFLNRTLPTRSETPPLRTQHPLQIVSLRVEPKGRPFTLDYLDGVKSWALRLHDGEKALAISSVKFLAGEDEESSEEEEDGGKEGEEEEEEDVDIEADVPAKRGKKKGKGRGRGRKKAVATPLPEKGKAKESPKKSKKITPSLEDVQVRLNGVQIDIIKGEWYVELPIGLSVVDVGAKDGMIWKVFAERRQG